MLSHEGVPHAIRDIHTDPVARDEWERLGVGVVPVAVLGERVLPIFHVDQLRGLLGLPPAPDAPPYQQLVAALERILAAVERAVRQADDAQLDLPTPNRGRDLCELTFNIHDPIDAIRRALDSGRFDWDPERDFARSRHLGTVEELADWSRAVRLAWFERALAVDDAAAMDAVATPRGPLTHLQILEAQARHAAQHLRQIYVFLRGLGIDPRDELTAEGMHPVVLPDAVF